jgi:hypothetical protein
MKVLWTKKMGSRLAPHFAFTHADLGRTSYLRDFLIIS